MRKALLIICIFFFCSIASAGVVDNLKKVIAVRNSASCSAPAWYNQTGITVTSGTGNVVFAWDANDQGGGVSYAYDSSCNELSGIISNGDIGTYQSATAFRIDAANETIIWTQTSNQYGDLTADQTICAKIFTPANPDANTRFIGIVEASPGSDYADLYRTSADDSVRGFWGPDGLSATGASFTDASWSVVGYTFQGSQAASNGDHGTDPGDGTYDTDADELDTAPTDGATQIIIGSWQGANPGGAGKEIYIQKIAIISGYEAVCSELTGW